MMLLSLGVLTAYKLSRLLQSWIYGSITSVRAIHSCKTLCDCEFHVARTIDYIPPPSSLYPLSTYWRSRECHNIVHGCFSTWGLTLVPHCTLFVCNSYVMCLCTSPPVHSKPYTVSSSSISATVSAALLAIALCKSDIGLQSGKIGEYPTKHIQGAVSMLSSFWYLKNLLQPRQIMTSSHVSQLQGATQY